jgi:hypothetical protein
MVKDKRHEEGDCVLCSHCHMVRLIVQKNRQGQLVSRCDKCRVGLKQGNLN